MFRVRKVFQEFEAHFQAVSSEHPKGRGKSEWKRYGDQSIGLKVKASGLNLPEGTVLDILIDGQKIGEMVLQGNFARFKRESEKGEHVPMVGLRQVIEITVQGQVILAGRYEAE